MTDDPRSDADEVQDVIQEGIQDTVQKFSRDRVWLGADVTMLLESNRPRGVLSATDREYILGNKEYEHPQSEANRRQDIRERVVNSFQDFPLLTRLLDVEEREKIFNEEISEERLRRSLEATISFIYLGLEEDISELEKTIERGIYAGANFDKLGHWSGEVVDVDTTIEVERRPDRSEIIQKFEKGETEQLTPAEVGILVRSGQLDADDLDKLEDKSIPRRRTPKNTESED